MLLIREGKPNQKALAALCAILSLFFLLTTAYTQEKAQKNLLILHSYHPSLSWTDAIMKGMQEALDQSGEPIQLHVEYMDARRYSGAEYRQKMEPLLIYKLAKERYDLVLLSDNDALDFFLENRKRIAPEVPVIFCGINNFNPEALSGHGKITGVAEEISLQETIDTALKLHFGTKEIIVIGRTTLPADRANREAFLSVLQTYKQSVKFIFWDDLPVGELRKRLPLLPSSSLVFINGLTSDETGRQLLYDETTRLIRDSSKVPLYSLWDVYLGYGIIGGKLISGYMQGKLAGELAVRVLRGEDPDKIPVIRKEAANKFMFDYRELSRFGLSVSSVPIGSEIVNSPSSSYVVNKVYMWGGIVSLLIFSCIILLLGINILARKRAEEGLRESEAKYSAVVQQAKDGVVIIQDNLAQFVNPALAAILGYARDEIEGMPFIRHVAPESRDQVAGRVEARIAGEDVPPVYEAKLLRKDGTTIDAELSANVVQYRGKPADLGLIRDIAERKKSEKVLRESEAKYRRLHESIMDAFARVDMAGRILEVNRAYQSMLGYSEEELRRLTYNDLTPEKWHAMEARIIEEQVMGQGYSQVYEKEYRKKDGAVFPVELRAFLLRDDAGQAVGMWAIVRDITERRKGEESLRQSEERMRLFFERQLVGMAITSPEKGWLQVNEKLCEMLGYSREELARMTWPELTYPDDLAADVAQFNRLLAGEIDEYVLEKRFVRKEGTVVYTILSVGCVRRPDGSVDYVLAVLEDITERKRAEEALRKSEKEYRSVIENIQDVFYRSDREGRLVMGSPSGVKLFGFDSFDEMRGLSLDSFWPDPKGRERLLAQMKAAGSVRDFEAVLKRKDGSQFNASFTTHFHYDDQGNLLGTEGIIQEITERKRAEEALRESEERYRRLVEFSPESIVVHCNERYVYVNPAGLRLLGVSKPEEIIGRSIFDIIHPDYWGIIKERNRQIQQEGKEVPLIEEKYICPDGRILDVEVAAAPFEYQGQSAVIVVVRDITERKQAEGALRRSEEEAQRLLHETAIMAEVGRIISSTLDIEEVYERFAGEVQKLIPFDRISINEVNLSEGSAAPVYVSGLEVPTRKAGDVYPLARSVAEEIIRRRAGLLVSRDAMEEFVNRTPMYLPIYQAGIRSMIGVPLISQDRVVGTLVLGSVQPNPYSEQDLKLAERIGNQISGAIANTQLFRDYKKTGEDLRQSEERYRRLIDNAPLGIISVDTEGNIKNVNPRLLSILGSPSAEATRAINLFTFPPLVEAGLSGNFRRCLESGESDVFETSYRSKWGKDTYLRYHLTPDRDPRGKITGVQGIVEDISERKRLEDQLLQVQKMEAIGTLAGGIAHDFNNILAVILGYAELANLASEDAKVKYNLLQSIKAAQRAKDLVQQILAFSRQGRQERKPLNVKPIIKEGIKFLRSSLPATIEIRQNIIEGDLGTIEADPTQVYQVLMNLCTNAAHAMGESGGILEISLRKVKMDGGTSAAALGIEPGSYLRLRVSDTGHGMPPEILKRIFDPYFTTKKVGKGTGLGLAVVHGIVKSHGGGIAVSSEPGKGTTFDIYFPRMNAPKASLVIEKPEPLPLGEQEEILLVDDEQLIVEIGQGMLEHLGYRVVVRTSSVEALELFRAKADQFDLVITDMTMPNLTGDKLAKELMDIRPDIPIILCTGFSEYISEEKAKALGIQEFVMKPLVMKDLAKAVRRALDSRKKKNV